MIGSPPDGGERNAVIRGDPGGGLKQPLRQDRPRRGRSPCVTRIYQTNRERFLTRDPGSAVPQDCHQEVDRAAVDEIPRSCNPTIHMSDARAPIVTRSEECSRSTRCRGPSHISRQPRGDQKLSACDPRNAMSFAPMSGGTIRFPTPARIGNRHEEIIVVPCIVNNSEYVSRRRWSVPVRRAPSASTGRGRRR